MGNGGWQKTPKHNVQLTTSLVLVHGIGLKIKETINLRLCKRQPDYYYSNGNSGKKSANIFFLFMLFMLLFRSSVVEQKLIRYFNFTDGVAYITEEKSHGCEKQQATFK
jgi:hypothetical protein